MRVIDADELKKMFMYAEDAEYAKWSLNGVIREIDDMPTVDMLDKIRAEIVEEQSTWREDADAEWHECRRILQIIDKYREEQTE